MTKSEQERILISRRAELVGKLQEVEHLLDAPATKDAEDFATERQGDEVLEALGHVELAELKRIDAALARCADGTYGLCMACGEQISLERLSVIPEAALCKACAQAQT